MKIKFSSGVRIVSIVSVCLIIFTLFNSALVVAVDVIVDDVSATFVGSWYTSTGVAGYYGSGYRTNYEQSGSATANWDINIPSEGSWEVFARWTSYQSRGTNVPYTINDNLGPTVVRVNQQVLGGTWVSLGVFSFDAGLTSVVMSNDADGSVCADAIKIVEVIPPQPLYQKLWSDSDSVKNDTSRITTTKTNLGTWTLPAGTSRTADAYYSILSVFVNEGKAAQFTVTAQGYALTGAVIEVWVDVNGNSAANMPAMKIYLTSGNDFYGTTTFVGHWFSIRLYVPTAGSPVPIDKNIEWAYMVVAPPGVEITEQISGPL